LGNGTSVEQPTLISQTCGLADSPCNQLWSILIDRPSTLCYVNGPLDLSFQLICAVGVEGVNCPLNQTGPVYKLVPTQILTENLCDAITITAGLTGTMIVYGSSKFISPQTVFAPGQDAFFLISVTSSGPEILSVTLLGLSYTRTPGSPLTALITNTVPSSLLIANNFRPVVAVPLQNEAAFAFTVSVGPGITDLFDVPDDQRSFTFYAEIEVEYAGETRKRHNLQSSITYLSPMPSTQFSVTASGVAIVPSLVSLLLCLLVAYML